MSQKHLKIHPFYIRSTLLVNSAEWKRLSSAFRHLKEKFGIPQSVELKWSNLWTIRKLKLDNKPLKGKAEIQFFEAYDYHILINFVEESLALLNQLQEKKIIITYTKNTETCSYSESHILKFHLQEHMQRIEMEIEGYDSNSLGVIFFDPVSEKKNEQFRKIYCELYDYGDFISKYSHIKDSLNFENSHQSAGIQIADYISGAFNAFLRHSDGNTNYTRGVSMFYSYVFPHLRRAEWGRLLGYGLREVPSNMSIRKWIQGKLNNRSPDNCENSIQESVITS